MLSKKYLKDFKTVYDTNSRGKLVPKAIYIGKYFEFDMPECDYKNFRLKTTILGIINTILFAIPIMLNSSFLFAAYVVVPYLVLFWPTAYMDIATLYLYTSKRPMMRERKEKIYDRLKKSSVSQIFIGSLTLFACIIYSFAPIEQIKTLDYFFIFTVIVQVLISIIIHKSVDTLKFKEVENKDQNV